uniref:Uncharacterized protein n=1 Tax=Oryza sativa subsp. japonica TaxID=39947 RepID=Q6YTN4_ORYSJ|nr:hypothetical protein [Oryza sativa Japonica Group]
MRDPRVSGSRGRSVHRGPSPRGRGWYPAGGPHQAVAQRGGEGGAGLARLGFKADRRPWQPAATRTVAGDGNRRRGKRRRTVYRTAASTEGDGERMKRGGANKREGKREERGSSPASMAAGAEDEGGGDNPAMRRGGRAAAAPTEGVVKD